MSLDTTVRYNAAMRTSERQSALVNTNTDEGNFLFDKNDLVLSRIDLYSEFDLNVRDKHGLRISGSAWYDNNFPSHGRSDPRFAATPNYPGNEFTPYVKRHYQGPSAEFLDAFIWGNFSFGGTQLNAKLGRYAYLPGEFLFGNGGSVSFSMTPNDGRKSDLSPGASAKETALPIGQLGLIWQLSPAWTVIGNYTGEFRRSRVSEGGTFFAVADGALEGPPFLSNPAVPRLGAIEGERGDVALGAKWSPAWANGDAFGLWYRKFDDKSATWQNQVFVDPVTRARSARAVFARDIELMGLTYNTSKIAGIGLGAELNYRKNMPLATTGSYGLGGYNDPSLEGARGNTWHALLSGVITINKNPIFDSGSVAMQLDYTRLDKITQNRERFNGAMAGVAGRCVNEDILRNCATRNAASIGAAFTPTWQQVFPSIDISMPIIAFYGLDGNAAAVGAGTLPEGSWLLRVGGRLEWYTGSFKHQFDLTYTTKDGKKGFLPGAATESFSGLANFRDRDYINFTYQTAF